MVRVLHLLGAVPALGGPLLEQPERVSIAVVEVVQVALLERGGQRDADSASGQSTLYGHRGNDRSVRGREAVHR
jgi:hypothetical protein